MRVVYQGETKDGTMEKTHDDGHAINLLQLFPRFYVNKLVQVLFEFIAFAARLLRWQQ
jgi:hypothetical protein